MIWFGSGASAYWDILGYMLARAPMCVDASLLSVARVELLAFAESDVMIDTGAFSAFRASKTVDWDRVISVQSAIARALRGRAYVVAPDVVGDLDATRSVVDAHELDLLRIHKNTVNIIYPCHGNVRDSAAWFREIARRFPGAIAGIPANEKALGPLEIAAFMRFSNATRIHFLGRGPRSHGWSSFEAAARGADITCDSSQIAAAVGQGRAITRAQERLCRAFAIRQWLSLQSDIT